MASEAAFSSSAFELPSVVELSFLFAVHFLDIGLRQFIGRFMVMIVQSGRHLRIRDSAGNNMEL